MKDTVTRSIVKTFFFKVVTTGVTAFITGLGTALLLHAGLTLFYLIYERVWNQIKWGKLKETTKII